MRDAQLVDLAFSFSTWKPQFVPLLAACCFVACISELLERRREHGGVED
jgi:hypothetical protein